MSKKSKAKNISDKEASSVSGGMSYHGGEGKSEEEIKRETERENKKREERSKAQGRPVLSSDVGI